MHGLEASPDMMGRSLLPVLKEDRKLRDALIFGYFGGAINATDGRLTYHCFPVDFEAVEINQYTLMPTHMNTLFTVDELRLATLSPGFGFTKGVPVLKIPMTTRSEMFNNYGPGSLIERETRLFDVEADPMQRHPIQDPAAAAGIRAQMLALMRANEAPPEAYRRIGAPEPA
jgi:hypothetical protein